MDQHDPGESSACHNIPQNHDYASDYYNFWIMLFYNEG